MWYILKQLWFKNKVRKYNKKIIAMTQQRQKVKRKQQKYTELYETYSSKID